MNQETKIMPASLSLKETEKKSITKN